MRRAALLLLLPALAMVACLLAAPAATAAPFLQCAPYPAGQAQPTEFVVTISGITQPIVSPAVDTPAGKILKLDLGPLNLSGLKTVTAKARSAWGESAATSPFSFTAGTPAPPSGFTLSGQ